MKTNERARGFVERIRNYSVRWKEAKERARESLAALKKAQGGVGCVGLAEGLNDEDARISAGGMFVDGMRGGARAGEWGWGGVEKSG